MNLLYTIQNYYLYYVLIIDNINYCKCVVLYIFYYLYLFWHTKAKCSSHANTKAEHVFYF